MTIGKFNDLPIDWNQWLNMHISYKENTNDLPIDWNQNVRHFSTMFTLAQNW